MSGVHLVTNAGKSGTIRFPSGWRRDICWRLIVLVVFACGGRVEVDP